MHTTEIWFIRHGETAWNRERRMQGWQDIALNDAGRQQAAALAARLAAEAANAPFAALYASPLARAFETARAAAARLGLPVQPEPGLRERNFGVLEGLAVADTARLAPAAHAVWQRRDPNEPLEGGEALGQFQSRVVAAAHAIARRHPGQQVLAVTHGGVLDVLWCSANQVDLAAPRTVQLLNASVNRIGIDAEGHWRMLAWADIAHLDAATLSDVTP